jgi:hypothetical protein
MSEFELPGARREPLDVVAVHERPAVGHEQRAGLDQVARRVGRQLGTPGEADRRPIHVHAGARRSPRLGDGLVRQSLAVGDDLAQRPVRVTQEKPRHDRLGLAVGDAPTIETRGLGEAHDAQGRALERMARDVDGRVAGVARADAQELVGDRHRGSLSQ